MLLAALPSGAHPAVSAPGQTHGHNLSWQDKASRSTYTTEMTPS